MLFRSAVLSVFFGNHKWEMFEVNLDDLYSDILIGAEENFWKCVREKTPPFATKVSSPIDAVRRVDMTGSNAWANYAVQLQSNSTAKKLYDDAVANLKKLVEDDVAEAYGHGIRIKRDKRGALRISE